MAKIHQAWQKFFIDAPFMHLVNISALCQPHDNIETNSNKNVNSNALINH